MDGTGEHDQGLVNLYGELWFQACQKARQHVPREPDQTGGGRAAYETMNLARRIFENWIGVPPKGA